MNRTTIIQNLIDTYELTSYLEIGIKNGDNYKQIKCKHKVGVDPEFSPLLGVIKMTSDEFFELNPIASFSLVFIDGLHHSDQVERDIINSIKTGARFIVVHDCNPTTKLTQIVPRLTKEWYGDVWRAFVGFKMIADEYTDGFNIKTYDVDCGVGVIETLIDMTDIKWTGFSTKIPYSEFDLNRKELLNLI